MSDETGAETAVETEVESAEPKTFDAEYVRKLRDEAAKYRTQAKENSGAVTRLAEIEEASKTEAQKLADRAAAAEAKVTAFEAREQIAAWKTEVAEATGVPAAALSGSTLEDLQAHAAILKPLITAPPVQRGPLVPTEGTRPGGGQVSQLAQADLKGMTPQQINTARAEGRLNDILGIKP